MASTISSCSSDTSSHRRSPSGWSRMITSATPSTAAASRSSRSRTRPRSPFGTSAGSLIDPASPRVAQRTTTRAPASARRASVPPQASDSSSGCAKIPSTVRPARGRRAPLSSATTTLHETRVDMDIAVDHPLDAEASDRLRANATAVEVEHARQFVGHLLEVFEDHPGHPMVHDFADGAAIERGDGRPACHRFGEHESERLARLNRVEQRARGAVELHLGVEVGFAVVHNMAAVNVRRDALAQATVFGGGENQLHADALGDFDRLQHTLSFGKPPEEQQVVLRLFTEDETVRIDAMQHGADDVQPG